MLLPVGTTGDHGRLLREPHRLEGGLQIRTLGV